MANDTWKMVDKPENVHLVSTKWVFKIKKLPNGQVDKFEAWLVARGFSQRQGIDFLEVFSGVVRLETLGILIAVAAILDLEIEQMDFTSAFTQGVNEEDIFLAGVDGADIPENKVMKLKRSLEGLKQSGRVWNSCRSNSFKEVGLSPVQADSCVFVNNDKQIIVVLYVDEVIFSSDLRRIEEFKKYLLTNFKVRNMGKASTILSINITRD